MKPKQMNLRKYGKTTAKIALVVILAVSMQIGVNQAQAASATQMSDTMSRLKASTLSNHEIKFVTPTGVAAGQSIILTFSAGFTGVTNVVFGDVDFAEGSTGTCSSATFTEKTLAATPATTTWGADGDTATTVTITSGTDTITAGRCVRVRIGDNAVSGGTGTNRITNGAIGSSDTIAISGTFGDTGSIAIDIIANDQITVTATVDPTITYTLTDSTPTDNAVGFGTLTTANARYATADSTGSTTDPVAGAAVANVTTNASGGYALSYNGDTLKSGSDSIPVATITADADGTPNTAQFSSSYEVNNSSTVTAGYEKTSNNWNYVANTTTTVVSRTTPTTTETTKIHFLANISGLTPAGSYSTTITYIATARY
jgi:hypothetical protein